MDFGSGWNSDEWSRDLQRAVGIPQRLYRNARLILASRIPQAGSCAQGKVKHMVVPIASGMVIVVELNLWE
jgi:hypothetical protein